MEKERLFLYQLYASLYRCGLIKLDVSKETLKKLLPYLKSMLEEKQLEELEPLFMIDEDGLYPNYLEVLNNMDPLLGKRDNNELVLCMDKETANIFNDDDVNYIGEKVAAYIKIKEKEKVFYENS